MIIISITAQNHTTSWIKYQQCRQWDLHGTLTIEEIIGAPPGDEAVVEWRHLRLQSVDTKGLDVVVELHGFRQEEQGDVTVVGYGVEVGIGKGLDVSLNTVGWRVWVAIVIVVPKNDVVKKSSAWNEQDGRPSVIWFD